MTVLGSGEQTVSELVAHAVEIQQRIPPWQRPKIIPLDPLALETMRATGLSESSVPDKGIRVPLRRIESTEWGGVDEDVTNLVHPENVRIALEATRLFCLNVAGVDIISPDIGVPWYENGAVINEVNFAPLLGGGEISKLHIPLFLDQYIGGDGRIPVEVFVGGEAAWTKASDRWRELLDMGVKCYLANEVRIMAPSDSVLYMANSGLYQRVRSLILSSEVEAMVLVVQTDEVLESGLPLEFVDAVTHVDNHLVSYKSKSDQLSPSRTRALIQLLEKW